MKIIRLADAINPVGVFVEIVESHFVPNPQCCNSKAGKSYRQSNDAHKCLTFVFPQIAESYFDVMF
jgi:hypothetical protein